MGPLNENLTFAILHYNVNVGTIHLIAIFFVFQSLPLSLKECMLYLSSLRKEN